MQERLRLRRTRNRFDQRQIRGSRDLRYTRVTSHHARLLTVVETWREAHPKRDRNHVVLQRYNVFRPCQSES